MVLAWGVSWIINSRHEYYQVLENMARELFILKKNDFVSSIVLNNKDILYSEKRYIQAVFPYVREINFLIVDKNEYVTKPFKRVEAELTEKSRLRLEKIYPIYIGEFLIGNVDIVLEDKKLKESIYISTFFLIMICLAFIGIGYYILRSFSLEESLKTKKDELNKNISFIIHDLKNPITAINNIAYLLQNNVNEPSLIERIKLLTEDLQEKISYIINITKVDFTVMKEKKENINLYQFVSSLIEKLLFIRINNPIVIENKIDKRLNLTLPVDVLEIVLDNLISNAIKYTKEGKVSIESVIEGVDLKILITDTGIGIPSEEQNKVFDIFYRSSNIKDKNIKGTGVGLTLVKRALDHLKWDIKLESPLYENGKGTRVIIRIPFYARLLN